MTEFTCGLMCGLLAMFAGYLATCLGLLFAQTFFADDSTEED